MAGGKGLCSCSGLVGRGSSVGREREKTLEENGYGDKFDEKKISLTISGMFMLHQG